VDGSVSDGLRPEQATKLVRARLGRLPQDMLEAAVVLEAWAGLHARAALDMGRQIVRRQPGERVKPAKAGPEKSPPATGVLVEGLSLLAVVTAVATWASPLGRVLSADAVRLALLVALPLTLSLQWGLNKRYLSAQDAIAALAADRLGLVALAAITFALPPLILGLTGTVASLLAATWVAGAILIRKGWGPWYALGVVATAVAMEIGPPPLAVLAVATGASFGAVAAALRGQRDTQGPPHARAWRRTIVTALAGACLGGLLVGDSSVGWGLSGALPALALVPSTIGSFWGALYLRSFHTRVPRGLQGMAIEDGEPSSLRNPAVNVLLGAVLRVCIATGALSTLLFVSEGLAGVEPSAISLLVGFCCVALASLVVSLLEAMGSLLWACGTALAAVATELGLILELDPQLAGAGLLAGSIVALTIGLPRVLAIFRRPASLVATNLWVA
jgi:hypothetical protein